MESQRTRLRAGVPYATVDGEDEIKGEIKSIVTIPALTNSIVYCYIYPTTHLFFLKQYSCEEQDLIKKSLKQEIWFCRSTDHRSHFDSFLMAVLRLLGEGRNGYSS